jgi:alpha-1,6-mannosyltransferase
MAAIAGFSTWIMVIFKPDGSHGMYSWLHVGLATAFAVLAWYSLYREPARDADPETDPGADTAAVSTP